MAVLPVDGWIFYTLIGGTLFAFALMLFIMIVFMMTPAGTFLSAKFRNKPIFLMAGRDGFGGFFSPSFSENQYAHFKKAGTYGITQDSYIIDRKSKQPIYIANKDIGASIQKDWPRILEQIKAKCEDLKTGKDYIRIVREAELHPKDPTKNFEIVLSGSTMRVSDLSKFFPLNIKPTYIDEYAMIAVRRERRKQNTTQIILFAAVLMLCIGIAGYLLISSANKSKVQTECTCNCADVVEQFCGVDSAGVGLFRVNGTQSIIKEVKPTGGKPGATLS